MDLGHHPSSLRPDHGMHQGSTHLTDQYLPFPPRMGKDQEKRYGIPNFQRWVSFGTWPISGHLGFIGCIFLVVVCPWQILVLNILQSHILGRFFSFCIFCNDYLKGGFSQEKEFAGLSLGEPQEKRLPKTYRGCPIILGKIVILCNFNKEI